MMNKLFIFMLLVFGCSEAPTQQPILVQPPIITEHQSWEELEDTGEYFNVGFYFHLKIEPRQVMYDFEVEACLYDNDALLGCHKGYAVSVDRAEVPFKHLGEFTLNRMSVIDTTVWGYASLPVVDIFRLGRGWSELTYTYYTDDGLSVSMNEIMDIR